MSTKTIWKSALHGKHYWPLSCPTILSKPHKCKCRVDLLVLSCTMQILCILAHKLGTTWFATTTKMDKFFLYVPISVWFKIVNAVYYIFSSWLRCLNFIHNSSVCANLFCEKRQRKWCHFTLWFSAPKQRCVCWNPWKCKMMDRFPGPRTSTHIDGSKSQFSEEKVEQPWNVIQLMIAGSRWVLSKVEGQASI